MVLNNSNDGQHSVPNQLAREYLSHNEGLTLTASTVNTYDSTLTEFVQFLHDRDASVLSAEFSDILSYIESCVRRGNRQSTVTRKLSTIGELYRYIHLRTESGQELALDPLRFREIDLSRYNTPQKIERDALSREEIKRLFDAFQSYRNRLMAVLGVETGIRNSEIRNLRLDDLNEDTIHVWDPKGSKPYDVPISDGLRFEFDYWLQHHRGGYAAASESEFVFPSQHGVKLETNGSLNTIVKRAAERAGIQEVIGRIQVPESQQGVLGTEQEYRELHRVTVHTFRHSFITLLADAGVGLQYRQLVANHDSVETTLGYDHSDSDVFESLRKNFDPPR